MTIDILIADEHEIIRLGLKSLFEGTDIRVIAEASYCGNAYKLAKKLRPQVVLLDTWLSGRDGLTCLDRIKVDMPDMPVIMFSSIDTPTCIARAVAMGASGYLRKDASGIKIIDAIRAVAGGHMVWSRRSLRRVNGVVAARAETKLDVSLTKLERAVLKQLAFGLTNKDGDRH